MNSRLATLLIATALVSTACFDTDDADSSDDASAPAAATTTTTTTTTTTIAAAGTSGTDDGSADTTTTTIRTEGAAGSATTNAPTTTEAPPPATEPTPTDPPMPDNDCLIGNWVITEDEMNAFYDAVEANIDEPFALSISGQVLLNMTATDYQYLPAFDLTLNVAGVEASGSASGSVSGTYVADGGVIVTTLGSSDMSMLISFAGTTMDASEIGNGFIASVPINDAPYSCDSGVPVIDFETGDGTPRHPVTLAPA